MQDVQIPLKGREALNGRLICTGGTYDLVEQAALDSQRDIKGSSVLHRFIGTGNIRLLLLHPWATLGGCMDDPVLSVISRKASQLASIDSVLMYNQRSQGLSSIWKGSTAAADAAEAVEFLHNIGDKLLDVVIVGYSYGACLAAAVAQHKAVSAIALVSPPVGRLANAVLGGRRAVLQGCKGYSGPLLLTYGNKDQFASVSQLEQLGRDLAQSGQVTLSVKVLQQADHFFAGQRHLLATHIANFIAGLQS